MKFSVLIRWTETAKQSLGALPKKVRQGIIGKLDDLTKCEDPRDFCKPLTGPLQGYYRIVYSRYRAVLKVEEEHLPTGDKLITLTIVVVAVGIRKELDKKDIYRVATKLAELMPEIEEIRHKDRDEQ